jgi:hypothetical protein
MTKQRQIFAILLVALFIVWLTLFAGGGNNPEPGPYNIPVAGKLAQRNQE